MDAGSGVEVQQDLAQGLAGGLVEHMARLREQSQQLLRSQMATRERERRKGALRKDLGRALAKEAIARRARAGEPGTRWPHAPQDSPLAARVGSVAEAVLEKRRARLGEAAVLDPAMDDEDEELEEQEEAVLRLVRSDAQERVSRRALADELGAYRLLGVSLFRTHAAQGGDRHVGLRFDTSFRGAYLERFYAFFEPRGGRLHRHTLPHFVPVDELLRQHDLRQFARAVSAYLNAFVSRREQVRETVARLKLRGLVNMESSAPFDVVSIASGERAGKVTLVIKYSSLLETVPSEVTRACKYGADPEPLSLEGAVDHSQFVLADFCADAVAVMMEGVQFRPLRA